ncbi:MAG: NUDIX domain-containing protein [Ruminococcaceae bacterium]|nr:NUDIX domain-containing protein [Oscillospiraceae bacterium]
MDRKAYIHNIIVVFCYLVKDGKVLLIKRGQQPLKGQVTIPAGKKKPGEDLQAACKREMMEETGLTVEKMELRGLVHTLAEGADYETLAVYFYSDQFSGEVQASDEGELVWCDIDESYKAEDISPFYTAITPFVFEHEGVFFGTIKTADGQNLDVNLY